MEVVNDPDMTVQEKRAILASWASDACAVEAAPDLRQLPAAPPVRFDEIMNALKRLDGEAADKPVYGKFINRARRWKDLYHSDRRRRSLFASNPGARRLTEAMKQIEEEAPGLLDDATLAATQLYKEGGSGGHAPQ
jgi:hypothetical protein